MTKPAKQTRVALNLAKAREALRTTNFLVGRLENVLQAKKA